MKAIRRFIFYDLYPAVSSETREDQLPILT